MKAMKLPDTTTPSAIDGGMPGFAGAFNLPPKRGSLPDRSSVSIVPSATDMAKPRAIEGELLDAVETAVMIQVELIDKSRYQPRIRIKQETIEELAENIDAVGLYHPIRVWRKDDGRYELITGERRLSAVRLLGRKEIAAVIREVDLESAKLETYVENLGREDLCPFETALIIKDMLDTGMARSQREVARKTTVSPANINMSLSYFKLPDSVQAHLREDPELVGLREAYDLGRLCDSGHGELVARAVTMMKEGRIRTGGSVRWVQDRLNDGSREGSQRRVFATRSGREVCSFTRNGAGKFLVQANDTKESEEIDAVIREAIASYVASKDTSDGAEASNP